MPESFNCLLASSAKSSSRQLPACACKSSKARARQKQRQNLALHLLALRLLKSLVLCQYPVLQLLLLDLLLLDLRLFGTMASEGPASLADSVLDFSASLRQECCQLNFESLIPSADRIRSLALCAVQCAVTVWILMMPQA